jgi:hypothetical protein
LIKKKDPFGKGGSCGEGGVKEHGVSRKGGNMQAIFLRAALVAAMVLFAAPVYAQFGLTAPPPQAPPSGKVLSSTGGRYVFGQISDSGKDQFMLDTHTGRLWRIAESSDVGTHLRAIPYRDDQGKVTPYPGEAPGAGLKEGPKN